MGKFNIAGTKSATFSPVTSEVTSTGRTYEGGPGYARDTKSELFLLAVSNMVGENTFYEGKNERDQRYMRLVHTAALQDPDWTARFLKWLRSDANMRSASIVGAAEYVRARLDVPGGDATNGIPEARTSNRKVVDSVLQRADEPGELLAYCTSKYGRSIPKPIKRGVADAMLRMGTEYNYLKWDSEARGFKFADVVNLTHPGDAKNGQKFKGEWQKALFGYIVKSRYEQVGVPETCVMLRERRTLMTLPVEQRREILVTQPERLAAAGMTWESLAGWLQGPMDAQAWEAIIPSMGYMALLRNLRNFDQAGVSDEVAAQVAAKLSDPDRVAKSRQFPFRFLSAYEQAPSLRWGVALEKALQLCLSNLPALPGRSLILVDTSASMSSRGISARSTVTPAKAAAVFGVSLAAKGEQVDLVGFADGTFTHHVGTGASVIREVDRFVARIGEVGHGTNIPGSLQRTYSGHDRVFIISDMQTIGGYYGGGVSNLVPQHVPLYGFNLGGYEHGAYAAGSNNRHEFGGLTDATFRLVPLLEAGQSANWDSIFGEVA